MTSTLGIVSAKEKGIARKGHSQRMLFKLNGNRSNCDLTDVTAMETTFQARNSTRKCTETEGLPTEADEPKTENCN